MRRRIPRSRGAVSGVLIVLLGLWTALVPLVGPYFHYAMHSDEHWQWFIDRGWLEVLPGLVAIAGGLLLMRATTRAGASFGAMLALAAGLWLVIGPNVSALWHHGAIVIGPPMGAHTVTRVLEWLGFFHAAGALVVLFSSYALGFLAALPLRDERVVGTGGVKTGRRRWRAPAARPVPAGEAPADEDTRVTTPA